MHARFLHGRTRLPAPSVVRTSDWFGSLSMNDLTPEGRMVVEELAQRHGFSSDAVTAMLRALVAGGGTMAQFNHPEFGGMGQWAPGGMVMIGDMFNNALKARVDALGTDLSGRLGQPLLRPQGASGQWQSQGGGSGQPGASLFVGGGSGGGWWPAELGAPGSTGSQNEVRYAYFPGARRLAIEVGGKVTVYDTRDHQIGGFSQQQGGGSSLTFTSQHGLVRVADLPVVSPSSAPVAATAPATAPAQAGAPGGAGSGDVLAIIERLAELRQKGLLSEQEFGAKKAELLSRL
jgi:hypothetical protein